VLYGTCSKCGGAKWQHYYTLTHTHLQFL
jgi:hypothetical protein